MELFSSPRHQLEKPNQIIDVSVFRHPGGGWALLKIYQLLNIFCKYWTFETTT
jgi:hypothetical protein